MHDAIDILSRIPIHRRSHCIRSFHHSLFVCTCLLHLTLAFAYLDSSSLFFPVTECRIKETHQLAELSMERNDKLREAMGISSDFKDGSSLQLLNRDARPPVPKFDDRPAIRAPEAKTSQSNDPLTVAVLGSTESNDAPAKGSTKRYKLIEDSDSEPDEPVKAVEKEKKRDKKKDKESRKDKKSKDEKEEKDHKDREVKEKEKRDHDVIQKEDRHQNKSTHRSSRSPSRSRSRSVSKSRERKRSHTRSRSRSLQRDRREKRRRTRSRSKSRSPDRRPKPRDERDRRRRSPSPRKSKSKSKSPVHEKSRPQTS